MKPMRKPLAALLLVLPTLLLAGWAAAVGLHRASLTPTTIAIQGFDPRDLLRGAYVEFRLDLPEPADAENPALPRCACLAETGPDPWRPAMTLLACDAPEFRRCPRPLRAPDRSFRLYASEVLARQAEDDLRHEDVTVTVDVRFIGDGEVYLSDLRVHPVGRGE